MFPGENLRKLSFTKVVQPELDMFRAGSPDTKKRYFVSDPLKSNSICCT